MRDYFESGDMRAESGDMRGVRNWISNISLSLYLMKNEK